MSTYSPYSETCPHCGKKLDVHSHWVGDYGDSFEFECPHCERPIDCAVEMIPEFRLSKGLTPDEQKARYQREREARMKALKILEQQGQ